MPGEIVDLATDDQQRVYDLIKQYFGVLDRFLADPRFADDCDLVGIVHGQQRVLNGHVYPIFRSGVDHTRFLRHGMTFDQHMQYDIDVWYETLRTLTDADIQRTILRIFLVMRHNLFVWKPGAQHGNMDSWGDPNDAGQPYEWPLASALSHGSRVCFIIPKSTHGGFRKWLTCDSMARGFGQKIFHRPLGISTHQARPVMTPHGADVDEGKATMNTGAYGINLGMGGVGNPSPIVNRVTTDDGSCGHLYIYESNVYNLGSFLNPDKYKIMMIGIEASYGSDWDLYGSYHGTGPEQNGTGVGIYWHRNVSGKNHNYIGMDTLPGGNVQAQHVPAKYGGMVVRMTQTMQFMNQQSLALTHVNQLLPVLEYNPAQALIPPVIPQQPPPQVVPQVHNAPPDFPEFSEQDWE